MPQETAQAVAWAIGKTVVYPWGDEIIVTRDTPEIVDKVREYFNANGVEYETFSYADLLPYLETI